MASISKLSIRGVRSFSPTDEEQVIGFCFPLTIIVGANGCGKTTIIEALKYAVTGSLPPGNKSGQSFVHDPKAVGQSVVKANIKLRFNNRGNNSMVVIRSMEVSQKKTTASFKALDGILRTVDPTTGQRVSLSHKCTELDRQIPHLMGVSKPILEHVVFCHQEDSSWPLQEGAVLKKRFDDIFDSTRYAKALDAIKSSRKEYALQVKDLKAELEGLKSHKHAAQGFREEMETCLDEISGVDDQINDCLDKIQIESKTMRDAKQLLTQIEDFQLSLDDKRSELEREEAVQAKQKELLGQDDMTEQYSQAELKEMLKELDDKHGNQVAKALDRKKREYENISRELENLRRRTNELNSAKGKLEAEKEAHLAVLRQRFQLMEEIHKKHKLELLTQSQDDATCTTLTQGSSTSRNSLVTMFTTTSMADGINISAEDMASFQRAIREKENELRNKWEAAKRKHRREEDELQKDIAELQAKKSAVDNDRKRTEMSKNAAMRELSDISNQMSSSLTRVRKGDVEEAKRQAIRLAQARDDMNNDPRREAITKEIRVQEDKLKSISTTIEQDMKIRDQLRLQSDQQNEIDMLERQVAQEFEVLDEKIKDNSFLLNSHGESVTVNKQDPVGPVDVLANNVRRKHLDAEHDMNRCSEQISEIQMKVSEKKALLGSHRQRLQLLQRKSAHLNREDGSVQKIGRVIRAVIRFDKDPDPERIHPQMDPSVMLTYLTDQINDISLHDEKPEHTTKVMKRLKRMARENLKCPCCMRDFLTDDDIKNCYDRMNELADPNVSELILMSRGKSQEARAALVNYENWRKIISQNINEFLDFGRVNEDIKEVERAINDEGETELNQLEANLNEAEAKMAEKKEIANELQQLLAAVNNIQDTAKRVWEKMGQVKSKKDSLKYMFCGEIGNDRRDLKTVEKDLTKSSEAKEAAYAQINKLNNEQKTINEKISRITNQASTAERSAREKEDTYNRDQAASKRRDELNESLVKLADEDKALEKQIAPLRQRLMEKESDRDRLRDSNNHDESMLNDDLREFEKDASKLQEILDKIDVYVRSKKEDNFKLIQQRLTENAEEIREEEGRLNAMEPEIEQLKRQVNDGERQKKTIQDNLDLIKLSSKVDRLCDDVDKLEEELDAMGGQNAQEEYNAASAKMREHQEKKARCEGRRQGLSEQKRTLKRKLNEEEYKDIDERHRVKMIEHETTQIAVTDLDKYYDALDKALLRYHGMKINDINKIIRELWTLTYKGEDITNIEIVSGQDSSSRANRSYNYRIVMSKGNTQMDMRGRCSAGQRVLASIVIRLALAETFCLNCGVLSLDEPTTNLDYENKRGLAIALAQIIASRAAQANFQLVVITHDEDFVSMMKQELSTQTGFNMPERYYQVSREEGHDGRYYSKINAIDWDEL